MKRMSILFFLLLAGLFALFMQDRNTNGISLSKGRAFQSAQTDQMFMVSLKIDNAGGPDRLTHVSSPAANHIAIMNPAHQGAPIVLPAQGTAFFAMDGAHIILTVKPDKFAAGTFIPLTLEFANGGPVSIRVQNMGLTKMNHQQSNGVSQDPTPKITLNWQTEPSTTGAELRLTTQDFTFTRAEDGAEHIPNQGHAHVYLNGLKLGRLYEKTYILGALTAGLYQLSVALNSNDHRPYLADNRIVAATLDFEIAP